MADVPLGMFLSGGLDSSAIAALMARMIDRPLQTFSVAFKERAFSELDYARQVAKAINADAHEVVIDDAGLLRRAAAAHLARGRADRASVEHSALLRVRAGSRACEGRAHRRRQRRTARRLRQVPARAWRTGAPAPPTSDVPRRCAAGSPSARAERSRHARPLRARDRFSRCRARRKRCSSTTSPRSACGVRRRSSRRAFARLATPSARTAPSRAFFDAPNGRSTTLDRLLYADMKTYLVELLMKQDQMSMAASIESRVPFLDHHLVEFAAALADTHEAARPTTKWILREAVRDVLPPEILTRKKMGFPVPFGVWMRGPWKDAARDVLLDARSRQRGIIDPAAWNS